MRILMLIHSLRRGGAERICLELAAGFIRRGDVVEVAAWVDVDEYPDPQYKSVKRHYLMAQSEYRWVRSLNVSANLLRELVAEFEPEVIQIHTPNVMWLAAWARLKVPCVHVLHGYGDISNTGSIKGMIYKIVARSAQSRLNSIVVAVSDSMLPVAARYYHIAQNDIIPISNGIDITKFELVKFRPNPPLQIIMIGTLCDNKGQKLGVDAFRWLIAEEPDAILNIVGDGEDKLFLRDYIYSQGLEKKVTLLGRRLDVAALLAKSHVLWQLSQSEAMPMVVLEAMAVGIPVVGFDVRGTCDAVDDGTTGYLVNYRDTVGIAKATLGLWKDQEKWRAFSYQARQRAARFFNLETMIEAYRKLFVWHRGNYV